MAERRFQVRQSGRKLQVAPADSAGVESEIDRDELTLFVDEVRADLATLCEEYMKYPAVPLHEKEKLEHLRMVAKSGSSLKDAIFSTEEGRRQSQSEGFGRYTFVIAGDVKVHVPWGLLFDKYPGVDFSLLSDEQLRAGFWAMKHDVSAVYRSNQAKSLDDPSLLTLGETGLLGILHGCAVKNADPEDKVKWPHALRVSSIRDLKRHFINQETDCLLYFFCHAEEDVLEMNGDKRDVLSPARFRAIMGAKPCGGGLFILNGCKTGVSHKGAGRGKTWLEVTRAGSLLGFVGTEAAVPTIFAWNLGMDLLHLMLVDGKTVREAMHDLRKLHWPLSLLYGLYCVPNVTVRGPVGFLETETHDSTQNYSLIPLGDVKDDCATLPFRSLSSAKR